MSLSTVFRLHPGPVGTRWAVAYVLSVPALELRHPVMEFVLVISGNSLFHPNELNDNELNDGSSQRWANSTAGESQYPIGYVLHRQRRQQHTEQAGKDEFSG